MALARRGWIALAGLALVYAWIWVVSAHRIDGQPFSGFAPVFVTGCGDFEHFYHAARAMRDGTPLFASGVPAREGAAGRPRPPGGALGGAVSSHPSPLLSLPYLLMRRRFAAAAWMVAGIVGFGLLPAVVSGWHSNLQDLRIALAGILGLF